MKAYIRCGAKTPLEQIKNATVFVFAERKCKRSSASINTQFSFIIAQKKYLCKGIVAWNENILNRTITQIFHVMLIVLEKNLKILGYKKN